MQAQVIRRCEPRSGEAILSARDPHALYEGSGRRFIFSHIFKKANLQGVGGSPN